MACPVCTVLDHRLEDLHLLYSHVSAAHLRAVMSENADASRQNEEIMFSYSAAIKRAEDGLKQHRLLCGSNIQ
jgi:hypothetical protein